MPLISNQSHGTGMHYIPMHHIHTHYIPTCHIPMHHTPQMSHSPDITFPHFIFTTHHIPHAWLGACMARGVCSWRHAQHLYNWQAGGTHPTRMRACFCII